MEPSVNPTPPSVPAVSGMAALTAFAFEGAPVRLITRAGEPWFVLADVCRVLEIGNVGNASARLDDDEKGSIRNPDATSAGGNPNVTIISESGLYSLVLTSRKPEAKRFKKWVTAEVLPAIRKTGSYGAPDPMAVLNDPVALRGLLAGYSEKVIALEARNAELAPKAEALTRLAEAEGSMAITDAAKVLQVPPRKLFAWLMQRAWIFRRPGGDHYIAYQAKLQAGDLSHKVTTVQRSDGTDKITEQVRITPKGLTKLGRLVPLDLRKTEPPPNLC